MYACTVRIYSYVLNARHLSGGTEADTADTADMADTGLVVRMPRVVFGNVKMYVLYFGVWYFCFICNDYKSEKITTVTEYHNCDEVYYGK